MANLEERIKLIKDIKKFAVKKLGITPNISFRRIKDVDVFFVVYASRKDKVESVLGRWGNELFEDKEECQQRQKELESKGYDTLQMTWEAYGAKDCPITKSMIRGSKTRLTYLVLHENWHIHCTENKIKLNPNVEEAVGDCFAYQGALLYYESNPQMKGHIKRDLNEWMQFYAFAKKYLTKLELVSRSNPLKVRRILQQARCESKELLEIMNSKEVQQRLLLPINNAFFLRLQYYAPMAMQVFEVLKNMHPQEYVTNRKKLYSALRKI